MNPTDRPQLLSREALRRAALARSARRSATVARRRLAWRWVGHGLRLALIGLVVPALLLAAAWAWRQGWRP